MKRAEIFFWILSLESVNDISLLRWKYRLRAK